MIFKIVKPFIKVMTAFSGESPLEKTYLTLLHLVENHHLKKLISFLIT